MEEVACSYHGGFPAFRKRVDYAILSKISLHFNLEPSMNGLFMMSSHLCIGRRSYLQPPQKEALCSALCSEGPEDAQPKATQGRAAQVRQPDDEVKHKAITRHLVQRVTILDL